MAHCVFIGQLSGSLPGVGVMNLLLMKTIHFLLVPFHSEKVLDEETKHKISEASLEVLKIR